MQSITFGTANTHGGYYATNVRAHDTPALHNVKRTLNSWRLIHKISSKWAICSGYSLGIIEWMKCIT